ncbi:hypothetical protein D1007_53877 [Hordeum vulgare]|nr:hypothetical protein D1007_53877 [Hordeum vulgare]
MFMRNSPRTFTETAESLDADDWILTIEVLLALVKCNEDHEKVLYTSHFLGGTVRAWWDAFKVMQGDCVITWADFKQGFHTAHIPSGIMAIEKYEFLALKQGSGSVKSTCRSSTSCRDKRRSMEYTRKSKMISKGTSNNQNCCPTQPAPAKTNYQPQQATTPAPRASYQPQQYANPRPEYNNPNNNTAGKTNNFGQISCFGCGEP